ncbi:MAG TPA: lipocalin family protein [Candidatus Eisenbacteria bacterium]|nr:lipocalin family protein [Candidatus Eisenbacteria bacterium]
MNASRPATVAILLILLATGCGKDDEVGPKPDEITGFWRATKLEYVSKANPATRVDLVAAGGAATLDIRGDHTMEFIITESGSAPDTTTGTWSLDGDLFQVSPTGSPWSWTWDVSLSGGTLALSGADVEYDFDGDDVPEEADQNVVLVR